MIDGSECNGTLPRVRRVERSHICELIQIAEESRLSPWTAQNYLDELKNENSIMFRLEADDSSTIGFIVGRTVPGREDETDAEIYNIAVVAEKRKRGCGQNLFNAFVKRCQDALVANVWLEVRKSNLTAINFYGRNGFNRVQTRNHFYENPREQAIVMKMELDYSSIPLENDEFKT